MAIASDPISTNRGSPDALLLQRMRFEKLHNCFRRSFRIFMAAGMDNGHHGRPAGGVVKRAIDAAIFPFVRTPVRFASRFYGLLLILERNGAVVPADDVQQRLRNG